MRSRRSQASRKGDSALESLSSSQGPVASADGKIRLVIADDQAIFRAGLRQLLEAEPDLLVVGEAASPEEAVALCERDAPHVLLLDVNMSGGRGVEALERLGPMRGSLRVLLLTSSIDRSDLVRTLQLGAYGVVLKETPAALLLKSIRRVRAGEFWVGRDMVGDLVKALSRDPVAPSPAADAGRAFSLTPREREIVAAVTSGYTNRQMAEKFGIAEDTIKHHLTNIFDKTGVSNRLELALFALHHRLNYFVS